MRYHHSVTLLSCALSIAAAMVYAQDRITEEDVVSALNGKPRTAAPGHPAAIAIHITFSSRIAAVDGGKGALSEADPQAAEGFYRTLIPLARALEAEALPGARYVIELVPTTALPGEDVGRQGQQLADTVEHFFTTYFAIPRERLSLHVSRPHPAVEGKGEPAHGPQRWRLEVSRQQ